VSGARTIVVGASHWHVPLYAAAIAEVHCVVGLSDEDPTRVRELAELWGAPVEADWRRLLELPDVELAYVFSPHDRMAETCLALIERRIPFVVEKPLGTSLKQLQQVRRAAEEAQVPATVPLIQRGGPADSWLAKAGRPVYQRLSFIAGPPERYDRNGNGWMLDPERAGGGCLANLGPHFADLFLQRSGHTTAEVDGRLSSSLHGRPVEDHATLVLTTPDGREAIVEVGYAFPQSERKRYCSYSSAGEAGFASIETDGSATFTSLDGHTERAVIDVDSDPLYDPFVRQVARTLGEGFRGLPTLSELENVMRVIWRAYQAHREGQVMADVTIDDVAKAAGVHRSTVSRALSRPEAVKVETRELVLRVAEELGYAMSPLAQALRSKASIFVPLVVPDLINPFYAELATTMTLAAGDRGYQLVLCITNRDSERAAAYLTAMQSLYAPFVIVAPSSRVEMDTLTQFGFGDRAVVIDRVDEHSTVPSVTVDNRRGIELAFDHLRSLGHRRIGYVSGISGIHTAHERLDAYSELAGAESIVLDSGVDADAGARGAAQLLAVTDPPTAIIAGNDMTAFGVISKLVAQGLRVPTDVSVVGFDGLVLSARYNPVLTTIRQPIADMGNIAIDLAEKKALDGSVDHVVLTPELLVGASTAGPPA
jgi:DNA-binding LacI/PurR family transcriptional regulator/predicted dehydrogenase